MKSRIEQLMFRDEVRLPLLSLVPEGSSIAQLSKLRAPLLARLERVEESLRERREDSLSPQSPEITRRDERDMLKVAIDWIALQEEENVAR
ncbi:MAG: hypothetical protein ACO3XO_02370 [Bdellovibrionota bacterium]|jgi:hypothetical protein